MTTQKLKLGRTIFKDKSRHCRLPVLHRNSSKVSFCPAVNNIRRRFGLLNLYWGSHGCVKGRKEEEVGCKQDDVPHVSKSHPL